jgi:starvation-inducible outer membrane lipoprotein
MKSLIALAALSLTACVSLPADPTKMTPEQLREFAKDKNANVTCGVANSPYGRGVMVSVTLDKAVVIDGTVQVDNECKVTITNAVKK